MRSLARALGPARTVAAVVTLQLAAGVLLLAILFGIVPAGPGLTTRFGRPAPGDFIFFYPAGVVAAEGRAADAYDVDALTTAGRARLGANVRTLVWPYPPPMSLLMAPFGALSPGAALLAWVAVMAIALAGAGRLVFGAWPAAPLAILFPGAALALFVSQFTPVLALVLAAVFLGAASPIAGGLALGLLVIKPHFAVGPFVYLLATRRWRTIAAGAAFGAAIAAASAAVFGLEMWRMFFDNGIRHASVITIETPLTRFITIFAAAAKAQLPPAIALALHLAAAAIVVTFAVQIWRRSARASARALAFVAVTVQVTPYALDYDLVFFVLPWLLMMREAIDDPAGAGERFLPWLLLTILPVLAYALPLFLSQPITSPLMLIGLLTFVWWREARSKPAVAFR